MRDSRSSMSCSYFSCSVAAFLTSIDSLARSWSSCLIFTSCLAASTLKLLSSFSNVCRCDS